MGGLHQIRLTTDDDYVDMRATASAWEKPVKVAALIVWALVIGVAIYVLHEARLFDGDGGFASAWGACEEVPSKSALVAPSCSFPLSGPGARGAWEGSIGRDTSAPNVGEQVEDPSLVRGHGMTSRTASSSPSSP
jgi:hypothetical protein